MRCLPLLFGPVLLWSSDSQALRPGDLIRIEVFDNPELTLTLRVPQEGTVTYPLIGPLPALVGLTTEHLGTSIQQRLADGYLRYPQVTVTISELAPRQAHVLGLVGRPGAVTLRPGNPVSILQALSEAGGLLPDADRTRLLLLRRGPTGQRLPVPITPDMLAGTTPELPLLEPEDIVVVPAADRAFVLGKVTRPGAITFTGTEPISLAKALALAGGFDRFAREDQIQVLRHGVPARTVDAAAILAGTAEDLLLTPGDTVVVPESRF